MPIQRSYEKSHPWISFEADLRKLTFRAWLRLGEAKSKCEHIAGVPLHPEVAERLHQLYLVKGAVATTAIEGNTLLESEAQAILEGKLTLPPSREYLATEVTNIVEACDDILDRIQAGAPPELSPERIKQLNHAVLKGLEHDDHVVPGEFTTVPVGVLRYPAPDPRDADYLVDRLCTWINEEVSLGSRPGMELETAILKAILVHLYIAWIHPFGDGNGRTARLLEFQILVASGVPSPAAHLLSNHYNLTRAEYYRQLDYAGKSGGDIGPFIEYALQGFVDGLVEQLAVIREHVLDVTWRGLVYQRFGDAVSTTEDRRRRLVLDLSKQRAPVPLRDLSRITPRVAEAYARRTPRVLTRDVDILIERGLLVMKGDEVAANREQVLAFLPVRGKSSPGQADAGN